MGQSRRDYRYDAIYIEVTRILNPQFDSITIELTGAQVELLRNATMLFNSQDTFVDAYHDGYYLNASDADFDEISAIVASLEEKLMGDLNTVFGYNDIYKETQFDLTANAGTNILSFGIVPVDEIWIITHWVAVDATTQAGLSQLRVAFPTDVFPVATGVPSVANKYVGGLVHAVMSAGEKAEIVYKDVTAGDDIWGWLRGYKMKVPE